LGLVLVTPPAVEPINLIEAKTHLRVDIADDDTLITALITAARGYCEAFQNRAYVTQTWQLWLDDWPDKDRIIIPRPPLQSISSVKYYGTDDTEYVFDAENYFVDTKSEPGRAVLTYNKSWPSVTLRPANAVCVEFVAGYPAEGEDLAANVPEKIKAAIKLVLGHLYERREEGVEKALSELPFGAKALLWQERVVPV